GDLDDPFTLSPGFAGFDPHCYRRARRRATHLPPTRCPAARHMDENILTRPTLHDGAFDAGEPMKIGLIVECAPGGLEEVVCPKIIQLLAAETKVQLDVKIVTMLNKKVLILGAAEQISGLLATGYERVVVLWNENPPWTPEKDFGDKRCWHTEREQLLANMR